MGLFGQREWQGEFAGKSEAVDWYGYRRENLRGLLDCGMSLYMAEHRQTEGEKLAGEWQQLLNDLSAHLGGSGSTETAAFLVDEQAAINARRGLIPTF